MLEVVTPQVWFWGDKTPISSLCLPLSIQDKSCSWAAKAKVFHSRRIPLCCGEILLIPLSWPLIFHLLLHNAFGKLFGVAFPTPCVPFHLLSAKPQIPTSQREPLAELPVCVADEADAGALFGFNSEIPTPRTFPEQGWVLQSCLTAPSTLLSHTLEQMVHLSTGRVPQLIALDLPFFHFIWVRSGQPCLHGYVNIWMGNQNRMGNVKPPLIVWVGFSNSHRMN